MSSMGKSSISTSSSLPSSSFSDWISTTEAGAGRIEYICRMGGADGGWAPGGNWGKLPVIMPITAGARNDTKLGAGDPVAV